MSLVRVVLIAGAFLCVLERADAAAQFVRGSVTDVDSRLPVAQATIELLGSANAAAARGATDSLGIFSLALPRPGVYRVAVSRDGYAPYQSADIVVGSGEVVTLELRLGREIVPLEPLVVTGRQDARLRGFDERRRTAVGHFITREAIEQRRPARVTELLRDVPGVSLRRVGPSTALVQMRAGSRACVASVWIDGVQIRQYSGSTVDDMLLPNVLEAVEIYPSASTAPTQFNTGTGCGVILFWTRQINREERRHRPWTHIALGVGAAALLLVLFQ